MAEYGDKRGEYVQSVEGDKPVQTCSPQSSAESRASTASWVEWVPFLAHGVGQYPVSHNLRDLQSVSGKKHAPFGEAYDGGEAGGHEERPCGVEAKTKDEDVLAEEPPVKVVRPSVHHVVRAE